MPERPGKIAQEYGSASEYKDEIGKTGYARFNYQELVDRETALTQIIEGAADVALFNSGAAALHTALVAEDLRPGDRVVCARSVFATTKKEMDRLEDGGIHVTFVDSGDRGEVERIVREKRPRLFVAESIANSPNMEMLDMAHLGQVVREVNAGRCDLGPDEALSKFLATREALSGLSPEARAHLLENIEEFRAGNNPFVFRSSAMDLMREALLDRSGAVREIARLVHYVMRESARKRTSLLIDNTLPSPAILNPLKIIGDKIDSVIVESGTKHYQEGANEITLGVVYSGNPQKVQAVKDKRIALGTYLQPSSEARMPDTAGERMQQSMEAHARNALHLATVLDRIPGCDVAHPNAPGHANNELATQLAPQGAVTLFYVTLPEGHLGSDFMQRAKDAAGDRIGLGTSFGHAKTWLSNYGLDDRTIRVSAGSESKEECDALASIFSKILTADS